MENGDSGGSSVAVDGRRWKVLLRRRCSHHSHTCACQNNAGGLLVGSPVIRHSVNYHEKQKTLTVSKRTRLLKKTNRTKLSQNDRNNYTDKQSKHGFLRKKKQVIVYLVKQNASIKNQIYLCSSLMSVYIF